VARRPSGDRNGPYAAARLVDRWWCVVEEAVRSLDRVEERRCGHDRFDRVVLRDRCRVRRGAREVRGRVRHVLRRSLFVAGDDEG
jgi:hypothetical protein